jgi:acylphosphatase
LSFSIVRRRNTIDGSIEAVIRGSAEALATMVTDGHAGRPLARVREVKSNDVEGGEGFAAFTQEPTGDPRRPDAIAPLQNPL